MREIESTRTSEPVPGEPWVVSHGGSGIMMWPMVDRVEVGSHPLMMTVGVSRARVGVLTMFYLMTKFRATALSMHSLTSNTDCGWVHLASLLASRVMPSLMDP